MKNVNESLIIDVDEIKNDDVNLNEIRKQFDKEIKQMPDGMREIMINQKNMYLKIRKMEDEKIRFIAEIERLNNIINDLDKFLKDKIDSWKKANDDLIVKDTIYHERLAVRLIYDYLQELKGDGSNEKTNS